ncbi:hypothetical protein PF001_g12662 [Phytophthora fragariae]|uniref:Uncharacterized protein n=1 Tax=Phytophthora fragariae TaxID=53985 RepID=A0A6A4DB91_9STRA|nr:hypothetical protein PF001_g12662 [Phytophthora fragariae]
MERSIPQGDTDDENDSARLPNDDQVASGTEAAGDPRRERADGVISTLMNGVTTRHGARSSTRGIRTCAATRAAPFDIASWTSRTLINPRQRPRAIAYENTSGAAAPPVPPPANFDPIPAPHPRGTAAVSEFLQRRQSVVRYVRDAIAVAVNRQKENADRRGRKNMEKFAVGDRVLMSTSGIQPILVTNLGAKKLAPSYLQHSGFILLSTSVGCGDTIPRISPATLPLTSIPAVAPLRRLTLRHSVTRLLVLTPHHSKTAGEAIETLCDLSVLPAIALRLSATVLRLLLTVGVMFGILWKPSCSTTTLVLPRGRVAVFVTATAQYHRIVNTSCVGLGQCRIAGSRARSFSRTFRTAWRRTRQGSYRIRLLQAVRWRAVPSFNVASCVSSSSVRAACASRRRPESLRRRCSHAAPTSPALPTRRPLRLCCCLRLRDSDSKVELPQVQAPSPASFYILDMSMFQA